MLITERRFDVRVISSDALAKYMDHRRMTVRQLALRVGCSPATIGHLRSGKRDFVRSTWANAIEDALEAPRDSLFRPELSTVTREVRRLKETA